MNEYELTVLIHPDLEANLDSALDKVRGLITANGGEITKEQFNRMGYQSRNELLQNNPELYHKLKG